MDKQMTAAAEGMAEIGRRLQPISLDHVVAVADLQTRRDRKYLLPIADWCAVIDGLHDRLQILQIGNLRLFDYESVYFDTPDLLAYHRHAYGRRIRFKIRTRSYLDSAETALELKTRGRRSRTVKERYDYRMADRYRLDPAARAIVAERLGDQLHGAQPQRSLIVSYLRTTMLDSVSGSRLTCDVNLRFADTGRVQCGPDDLVLVESKTTGRTTPVETNLWRMGHRPVSVSKYCTGLALLNPELPANRWNRTLRRYFGWEPLHRQYQPS